MASGFIYFVTTVPFSDYPIKIGFSGDPVQRLMELQTANPYSLGIILAFEGTPQDERTLHWKFRHLSRKLNGEWFEPGSELIQYLAQVSNKMNSKRGLQYSNYHLHRDTYKKDCPQKQIGEKLLRVEQSQIESISELQWRHKLEEANQVMNMSKDDLKTILKADHLLRNGKKRE